MPERISTIPSCKPTHPTRITTCITISTGTTIPLGALYLDAECEKAGFQSPNAVILGHSLRIGGAITCFGNIPELQR